MRSAPALIAAALLISAVALSPAALGQEVSWRLDYVKARREAVEKGRPLVIDFSTENCYWCKQLDARTLRDPGVVALLNDRFIPVKLDGQREAELVAKLRIQSFPTTVIAAPDGRILDTVDGFVEAPRFLEQLQRASAGVATPDWMVRDLQEAGRAIAASDQARALALLRAIVEDRKDRPVQLKARQLLQDLEQQAAHRLMKARQLAEGGKTIEARLAVNEIVRGYAGTQAAVEGGQLLATMVSRSEPRSPARGETARQMLAQAREDYRSQQYLCCLDRCELLAAQYSDLPEGSQAIQLAAEIKSNPEWMREVCETMSNRLCTLYLGLAESCLQGGQPLQATAYLERVVQSFPGTRHAEAAQLRLLQIQGQPTRPVDFTRP